MNQPLDDKNMAIWNDQPLDTWSDIIVSFDYARYALNFVPTGGFAVVFFDSIVNSPRRGGRDYSLGYISNDTRDYCLQDGYTGLEAAFVGVGFDPYGYFALNTYAPGIPLSAFTESPSIMVRGGASEQYNLLNRLTLTNFLSTVPDAANFTIDQNVSATNMAEYRSVRVILSKAGTELKVQIKQNSTDDEYTTVMQQSLPKKRRTALKVALTNTTQEGLTQFKVKNFNVAGYPGFAGTQRIDGCEQRIIQGDPGNTDSVLCVGDEFISNVLPGRVATYATDTTQFAFRNNLYYGTGITLFGQDGDTIIGKYNGSSIVGVFDYLGERIYRTASIVTPDNVQATAADIDGDTLAICTDTLSGSIYVYNFNRDTTSPITLGTWQLYQTITSTQVAGGAGLGNFAQLYGDSMLISNSNDTVHAFRRNINQRWEYIQTITSPISSVTNFGATVAIHGNDAIIGAPVSQKFQYPEPAQGEAYHYVFDETLNQWRLAMAIGSFYNLNTPNGNFGNSVALQNNYALIGCPGEEYRYTPTSSPIVNVGRVYVFQKTTGGVFSQATVIAPASGTIEPYMNFGNKVGIYNNIAAILSPFTPAYVKSYISIYNLDCSFPIPPENIPIPECALQLIDYSGFILDTLYNTYMLSYTCQLVGPLP
jgi:hypothetical protein